MRARSLLPIAGILVAGVTACPGNDSKSTCPSNPPLEENQSLWVAPLGIDFGLSVGTATYIGTSVLGSAQLCNYGVKDLAISGATLSGPGVFKLVGINDADQKAVTTLKPNATAFVQLQFTPTAAQLYAGSVTINSDADKSNAADAKAAKLELSGCGINYDGDGGTAYCFPDAGH